VKFEVFTAVKIWIVVLWVMMLCTLAGGDQRFYPEDGGGKFL
jgi:hypothetical protein